MERGQAQEGAVGGDVFGADDAVELMGEIGGSRREEFGGFEVVSRGELGEPLGGAEFGAIERVGVIVGIVG